uniref:Uncharacterized protein n=1 Tax=Anguilla anguilla TaxID=7936 RepID=A0A0E9URA0_ANGAN
MKKGNNTFLLAKMYIHF